jgi:hypothetical protein
MQDGKLLGIKLANQGLNEQMYWKSLKYHWPEKKLLKKVHLMPLSN